MDLRSIKPFVFGKLAYVSAYVYALMFLSSFPIFVGCRYMQLVEDTTCTP